MADKKIELPPLEQRTTTQRDFFVRMAGDHGPTTLTLWPQQGKTHTIGLSSLRFEPAEFERMFAVYKAWKDVP